MAKKRLNEQLMEGFKDLIFKAVRQGNAKAVEKKIKADPDLQKKIQQVDQGWKDLADYLDGEYGEEMKDLTNILRK